MTGFHSPLPLGFLASHGGSNLQAILDAIAQGFLNAQARLVISNNSKAKALDRAQNFGIPTLHMSQATHPDAESLDAAIAQALLDHGVQLVVLAGYMRKIGPAVLKAYPGRILNIHPALLPKFGGQGMYGMNVHEAVLKAGEAESGATIHIVDSEYDRGPILAQAVVPVLPNDNAESLQARVLEQEHLLYPQTIARIIKGEIPL